MRRAKIIIVFFRKILFLEESVPMWYNLCAPGRDIGIEIIKGVIIMKLLKSALGVLACMLIMAPGVAASDIRVKVNDRIIAMDTDPYITGGHTLVPVRFVAEALGCREVLWDEAKRGVTIKDDENVIRLDIGKNTAYVNGKSVALGTAASIKNNRTYVPIRFVSENMGAEVSWDDTKKIVSISKDGAAENIPYSENDIFWLARIIHAEAQGEPFEGKVGVGNVVLNRVSDKTFPDNIYDVIFDRKNGVQFTPVANGTIYNDPSNACFYAADRALRKTNAVGDSLFFCNPEISTNTWIMKNRAFYSRIGKHNFYL